MQVTDKMVEAAVRAYNKDQPIEASVCESSRMRAALTAALAHREAEAVAGLTLLALQEAHIARQEEWCPDQKPDLSFRGNEMAGEVGEACNVIKKLERERHGWRGSRASKEQLAEELADVVHTAVLCAITAGIDIEIAVAAKFDATSEKNGLATRIRSALVAPPAQEAVGYLVKGFDGEPFYSPSKEPYKQQGHAIVPVYTAPPAVPEGMVLVPVEPTNDMVYAAFGSASTEVARDIYRAMLTAFQEGRKNG